MHCVKAAREEKADELMQHAIATDYFDYYLLDYFFFPWRGVNSLVCVGLMVPVGVPVACFGSLAVSENLPSCLPVANA